MKKILMLLLLLLGLAAAGAGYYIFVMKPAEDALATEELVKQKLAVQKSDLKGQMSDRGEPQASTRTNTQYFVNERRLAVRNQPDESIYPDRYLYKSDPIKVLEVKEGWGRISNYFVLEKNGPEYAEWVKMDGLVDWVPIVTKEEREEMLTSYVGKSDDFFLYKDKFFAITDRLIKEKICTPEDFSEVQGWMRSIKYSDRHVYFVYCGGLRVSDKIYFDVDSEEIFY
jgi:hypothetical protein